MPAVTVTALARQRRSKRLDVEIDGVPGLSVTPDIALQFGLRTGATLSSDRIDDLRRAQLREDAVASGLRLVSYRPRSEKELRDRMMRRFDNAELVDAVVCRLAELRLIDDDAFAMSWVENRERSGPRSRLMLQAELRSKGIQRGPADAAVETVDEADAAYRAAGKKAKAMAGRPFEEFRRKVGDLLLRRGFGYETANETVKRLWEETSIGNDPTSDPHV